MRFSAFSPFKFIEVVDESRKDFVNWFDIFPNGDNRLHCNDTFGVNKPLPYVYKTLRNAIDFQFQSPNNLNLSTEITVKMFDKYGTEVGVDVDLANITPAGWISGNGYEPYIYTAHVSLTTSYNDFYNPVYLRLEADSEMYVTNLFEVHDFLPNHVQIKYGNSENDFGMIFYDTTGEEPISYYYKMFVEAEIVRNPAGEKSTYTSDRGTLQTLRSTPVRGYTINIPAMPEWLMESLTFALNCNELEINKVSCSTEAGLEPDRMSEYFNGYTGTINFTVKNWDYRTEQTILTNYVLVDSQDEAIEDDNAEVIIN